jgi:hypothetical protein
MERFLNNKRFESPMAKLERAGLIVVIITIMMGLSAAAPLDVNIEEKISTTAEYDGSGFLYSTDTIGFINITNTGSDDLYDVWVAVDLNNALSLTLSFENASSNVYLFTDASNIPPKIRDNINTNADYFIHIPYLKQNEVVSYSYDVDDNTLGIASSSPFLIDESYNVSKIPANRDVTWEVYFNISMNDALFTQIGGTQTVSMNVLKYLSSDANNFGSSNWTSLGPISNPSTQNGGSPSTSLFDSSYASGTNDGLSVDSITLNEGGIDYVNISFTVQGNNSGTGDHAYFLDRYGFATIEFSFDGSVSGTQIVDVFATGDASISVNKSGPFQNASGNWVVWRGNATVQNTATGLTYILTNVTMWATATESFSNIIYGPVETVPNQQLAGGNEFTTSDIQFEYSNVPVIWANATFKLIRDASSGWMDSSRTTNNTNATYGSDFIVIEKIYVIGTYLVKVTKHVVPNSTVDNVFDVYLVVENLGGQDSPNVYVYDMIPTNFSEYNWDGSWQDLDDGNWINKTSMFAGNGSVTNPMSGYDTGYYWRLSPLTAGADGDGVIADDTEIQNGQTVVIFYQIQGSGEFSVLDAFIVGLDPMLSMSEQTSPQIKIVSGSAAASYESMMALATALLGLFAIAGVIRRE